MSSDTCVRTVFRAASIEHLAVLLNAKQQQKSEQRYAAASWSSLQRRYAAFSGTIALDGGDGVSKSMTELSTNDRIVTLSISDVIIVCDKRDTMSRYLRACMSIATCALLHTLFSFRVVSIVVTRVNLVSAA